MQLFSEKTASADFFEGSIKPQTLRKWRHYGRGPTYVRLTDGTIRYTREALEEFVAASTIEIKPKRAAKR